MPKFPTILQVLVASPEDVTEERALLEDIVSELNLTVGNQLGIRLELVKWETHCSPGVGSDAQAVINRQLPEDYDIFVGILWTRLGTPTPRAQSGTAEELEAAYKRFREKPDLLRIMFYFKDAPAAPSQINPQQLKGVKEFRERLRNAGVLEWSYTDRDAFASLLRIHLSQQMQDFGKKWGTEVSAPRERKNVQQGGTGGTVGGIGAQQDEDFGFIDLLELQEERFESAAQATHRMTAALEVLRIKTTERAEEINRIAASQPVNMKEVKRIANRVAEDMDEFVSRTEAEIPIFADSYSTAIEAFGRAAAMLTEFGPADDGKAKVKDALEKVKTLRSNIVLARQSMVGFRKMIGNAVRVTTALNRAKRRTLSVLDRLEREMTSAINTAIEVERTLEGLPRE